MHVYLLIRLHLLAILHSVRWILVLLVKAVGSARKVEVVIIRDMLMVVLLLLVHDMGQDCGSCSCRRGSSLLKVRKHKEG